MEKKYRAGKAIAFVATAATVLTAGVAFAEFGSGKFLRNGENRAMQEDRQERGNMRGGPFRSEESVSACKDKSEGDSCSFSMTLPNDQGSINKDGTCSKSPLQKENSENEDETLSCMPQRDGSDDKIGVGRGTITQNRLERAESMQTRTASRIMATQTRLGKLVDFLKSKSVDTSTVESDISAFKEKTDAVLEKYDALITVLKQDNPSSDSVKEAVEAVRTAEKSARDYFVITLRPAIRSAIDSIQD